jgi:nuclear transport factor 2 (NTF2) superfamily protein
MERMNKLPTPPWDMESAAARLQLLEDDYNSLQPDRVSANFTDNAEVRIGTIFLNGREAVKKHLADDWAGRKSFKLSLDLWGALKGRMAVRYELEWTDTTDKAYQTFGVQVFQFNDDGLIEMNYSSYNDQEKS